MEQSGDALCCRLPPCPCSQLLGFFDHVCEVQVDGLLGIVLHAPSEGLFATHGDDALSVCAPIVVFGCIDGHGPAFSVEKPISLLSEIQSFPPSVKVVGGCVIACLRDFRGGGGVVCF